MFFGPSPHQHHRFATWQRGGSWIGVSTSCSLPVTWVGCFGPATDVHNDTNDVTRYRPTLTGQRRPDGPTSPDEHFPVCQNLVRRAVPLPAGQTEHAPGLTLPEIDKRFLEPDVLTLYTLTRT